MMAPNLARRLESISIGEESGNSRQILIHATEARAAPWAWHGRRISHFIHIN